ncbi:MAG: hypothetical protein JXB10_10565 [Pirellulales bacterium]|nr:hypothetical protein [Pirellulales bacterium]
MLIQRIDGLKLFDEDLAYFTGLTQMLPVTEQARDFVIRLWHDKDHDGFLDAGEDNREIDVLVVKPWTDVGTWSTGQAALVKANADGASLEQLAFSITGNAADANLLEGVGKIIKDKEIDVTPLLQMLEQRVRDQIVVAAQNPNLFDNCEFLQRDSEGKTKPNAPYFSLEEMREWEIAIIFDGSTSGLKQKPHYLCMGMVSLIYARGLIKGANLDYGEFDRLNIHPFDITSSFCELKTHGASTIPLERTIPGDWLHFGNAPDCGDRDWQGEQVIKTDVDLYFGWNVGERSYSGWLNKLKDKWDKSRGGRAKTPLREVIGYRWGIAQFINIPKISQIISQMRNTHSP